MSAESFIPEDDPVLSRFERSLSKAQAGALHGALRRFNRNTKPPKSTVVVIETRSATPPKPFVETVEKFMRQRRLAREVECCLEKGRVMKIPFETNSVMRGPARWRVMAVIASGRSSVVEGLVQCILEEALSEIVPVEVKSAYEDEADQLLRRAEASLAAVHPELDRLGQWELKGIVRNMGLEVSMKDAHALAQRRLLLLKILPGAGGTGRAMAPPDPIEKGDDDRW